MRAKFTIEIPHMPSGVYPTDNDIVSFLRSFGWDAAGRLSTEEERAKKYNEIAATLADTMPELAIEEKDYFIFAGFLPDFQSKFIVSRWVENQITFRILHPNLHIVQKSTEKIVKKIINSKLGDLPLRVSNDEILIFERGYDNIIITGRVIVNPIKETVRRNRKDLVLAVVSSLVFFPSLFLLTLKDSTIEIIGNVAKELTTAALAIFTVSLFGMLQTYIETFMETSYDKIITWKVSEDKN